MCLLFVTFRCKLHRNFIWHSRFDWTCSCTSGVHSLVNPENWSITSPPHADMSILIVLTKTAIGMQWVSPLEHVTLCVTVTHFEVCFLTLVSLTCSKISCALSTMKLPSSSVQGNFSKCFSWAPFCQCQCLKWLFRLPPVFRKVKLANTF